MKLRRYLGCTRGRRKEGKPQHPAQRCTGGRAFLGAARDQEHPTSIPAWQERQDVSPQPSSHPSSSTDAPLSNSTDTNSPRNCPNGAVLGLQGEGNLSSSPGKEYSAPQPFHSAPLRLQESTPSSERGCPHGGWLG